MIKNELVSAIIPAYNAEKYIRDSVRSVLNQTYNNVEVIVVNDGSTDATKTIIEAEFLNNTNVILINTLNNGVSAARNIGLSRAGGGVCIIS